MSGMVRLGIAVAAAALLVTPSSGLAQQSYATGQNIAPAYEGWERNDDGSFNLVFGYMNRNWEEVIDVPVGPENRIEPGGPDQGQPTHFYPAAQPVRLPHPGPGRLRRQGARLDPDAPTVGPNARMRP